MFRPLSIFYFFYDLSLRTILYEKLLFYWTKFCYSLCIFYSYDELGICVMFTFSLGSFFFDYLCVTPFIALVDFCSDCFVILLWYELLRSTKLYEGFVIAEGYCALLRLTDLLLSLVPNISFNILSLSRFIKYKSAKYFFPPYSITEVFNSFSTSLWLILLVSKSDCFSFIFFWFNK